MSLLVVFRWWVMALCGNCTMWCPLCVNAGSPMRWLLSLCCWNTSPWRRWGRSLAGRTGEGMAFSLPVCVPRTPSTPLCFTTNGTVSACVCSRTCARARVYVMCQFAFWWYKWNSFLISIKSFSSPSWSPPPPPPCHTAFLCDTWWGELHDWLWCSNFGCTCHNLKVLVDVLSFWTCLDVFKTLQCFT